MYLSAQNVSRIMYHKFIQMLRECGLLLKFSFSCRSWRSTAISRVKIILVYHVVRSVGNRIIDDARKFPQARGKKKQKSSISQIFPRRKKAFYNTLFDNEANEIPIISRCVSSKTKNHQARYIYISFFFFFGNSRIEKIQF